MSFGGPVKSGARSGARAGTSATRAGQRVGNGPRPADEEEVDWERVAVFGTGIAIGAVLGASVALLFAPASGEEARAAIARGSARLARGGKDAWEELRDELEWATRRGKRRVGRRVQRARWAAEDFMDDRRRPGGWWSKRREAKAKVEKAAAKLDDRDVEEIVDSMC
jgi:gas vesicle protein